MMRSAQCLTIKTCKFSVLLEYIDQRSKLIVLLEYIDQRSKLIVLLSVFVLLLGECMTL